VASASRTGDARGGSRAGAAVTRAAAPESVGPGSETQAAIDGPGLGRASQTQTEPLLDSETQAEPLPDRSDPLGPLGGSPRPLAASLRAATDSEGPAAQAPVTASYCPASGVRRDHYGSGV
jgi:hypothetical protein